MEHTESGIRVHWAPRVQPDKIRQLYESEARGILDEELLEEVACSLYARCRAILRATDALNGRVECPSCGNTVAHSSSPEAILACEHCGWRMPWRAYHRTFQGKKLFGSGAMDAFQAYVESFDRSQTARDLLLAIDRMLHTFHGELGRWATAPAAKNVIDANVQECVALLNDLAYGDGTSPELIKTRERYRAVFSRSWVGGWAPDSARLKLERREAARRAREPEASSSERVPA